MWTIGFLVFLSLMLGALAWLFFVWSVKSGQYDDIEGAKYRMLDDEDEDPSGQNQTKGITEK